MTEQDTEPGIAIPPRPRRRGRLGYWMMVGPMAFLTMFAIAFLSLTGRPVVLPDWATARVERAINARTGGVGVDVGSVVLEVSRDGTTRVVLHNLAVSGPDGASLGQFNTVAARLAPEALMEGAVRPTALSVSGAQLTVRRAADGAFGVRMGGDAEAVGDLSQLLDRIDAAFASGPLAGIGRITAEDLTITLEDARSGRIWQVTDGSINLRNESETTEINLISELFDGTETLARLQLSFDARKDSRAAILTARVQDVPARDIAQQAPALAFLGALDARVSGALRTVIAGDGSVESLDGTLDIGKGALHPRAEAAPLAFNVARAYFSYDPGQQKLAFSEISVESDTLRASGRGQAYLRDFSGPWPAALLAQVTLSELVLAPEGVFADAVSFDRSIADFRLRLDPFEVDFGQVVLEAGAARVDGKGRIVAGEGGWRGGFDLSSPELTPERLLALWPLRLGPKTRDWLSENLAQGVLSNVSAAVRLRPGEKRPRFGFTFDFDGADLRFLPEMPHVTQGRGHAALQDSAFTIVMADGQVAAAGGGPVDVSGSSFRIADVFEKPGQATLRLATRAPLRDVLLVMDNPPFRVLSKAGRPADLLDARADLRTEAHFPLKKHLPVTEVDFRVTGALEGARSDTIVPGRALAARRLDVEVVPGTLTVTGPVTLDGLPLDVTLTQPLDKAKGLPGRVDGTVELSQRFLDTFRIALPPGSVAGEGTGTLALTLREGVPPDYVLGSDLNGLTLSLPALGWTKPAGESGSLSIAGRLGPVPEIDRLALSGAGLDAEGKVTLGAGGVFETAAFDRVTASDWFDAPVTIEGRGEGKPPRIVVKGGSVNLARRPGGLGGGEPVPISLTLDSLRITDTIALTGFTAALTAGAGLDGQFQARVNGGAPVSGVMVPQRGRTAFRVQGDNAGKILRDAGLFRSLDKGSFDLILAPRKDGPGFDGQIEMTQAVLGDQSILIGMLDAVSIVGLIDQLRGPGVAFDTIQGRFRLTDDRLTLTRGSAVGASLGVSLDGVYDIAAKRLDMQGVISPIYLLNAVGSVFTRKGEGLFGFTFKLRGPSDDPKVSVNPVSVLTPGMFREIFRRPPPK